MFKLWLDDIRPAPDGFFLAQSVNEAKYAIEKAERLGETKFMLDLDHDLGDYTKDGGDGIELVKWLAETNRHYEIKLHTMNPVGRQNMQAIIDRYWPAKGIRPIPIDPNSKLAEYDFFTGEKLRDI